MGRGWLAIIRVWGGLRVAFTKRRVNNGHRSEAGSSHSSTGCMSLNIFFWNLNKKDLCGEVCKAVSAQAVDVVILIENKASAEDTLDALKKGVSESFLLPSAIGGRFQVFSRTPDLDLSESRDADRMSFRRLSYSKTELSLGLVHFVDMQNWDHQNQSSQIQIMAQTIRDHENKQRHDRTILIGDFNVNPFDKAMNMATQMNAMMTKKCAMRKPRTVNRQKYPYFYNPMWGLLGDRGAGPPGTYHHNKSTKGWYGWNMLDQVLIRPDALAWYEDVEILASAGSTSLQTGLNRPNKNRLSDHFPLLLKLK